ncbi:hypothetical protein [Streptomyces spiramenti]|uniref:Integral membrane protein n=1 Tax=Streptomyces spiramenti TaxID=2720606 RepID=A0ABX1AKA4_9ACTN|nr:hypothetical protein [Streptomyces spiramenti]NJP65818.1 hypothetical protein [Streptomyces spiramenti]
MRPGRALRGIRAATFAAVCVVLAGVGHAHGGAAVPLALVCAVLPALTVVAWALAGRRRGPWAVTCAAVATQAGLHLLFAVGAPGHGSPVEAASHHGTAAHPPGAHDAAVGGPLELSLTMVAAHLLAAVVSGWWLAQGERAVFGLVAHTGARLTVFCRPRAPLPVLPRPLGSRTPIAVRPRPTRLLLHSLISRGPPRARAVV